MTHRAKVAALCLVACLVARATPVDADVAPEQVGQVARLPDQVSDHWLWVPDRVLRHSILLDGEWVARRGVTAVTNDVANSLITARNTAITNQAMVRVQRLRRSGVEQLLITEDAGPFRSNQSWIVELGDDAFEAVAREWRVPRIHVRRLARKGPQLIAVLESVLEGLAHTEVAKRLEITRREVQLSIGYIEELLRVRKFGALA